MIFLLLKSAPYNEAVDHFSVMLEITEPQRSCSTSPLASDYHTSSKNILRRESGGTAGIKYGM
jgi:hypothetical protein